MPFRRTAQPSIARRSTCSSTSRRWRCSPRLDRAATRHWHAAGLDVCCSKSAGVGLITAGAAGWAGRWCIRNQIGVDHRYADAGKWQRAGARRPPATGRARRRRGRTTSRSDQMKLLHVGDRRIVLARTEEGYVAFDDRCTHKGGPLADGALICGTVQCPGTARSSTSPRARSRPVRRRSRSKPIPSPRKADEFRLRVPGGSRACTRLEPVQPVEGFFDQFDSRDPVTAVVEHVRPSDPWACPTLRTSAAVRSPRERRSRSGRSASKSGSSPGRRSSIDRLPALRRCMLKPPATRTCALIRSSRAGMIDPIRAPQLMPSMESRFSVRSGRVSR